GGDINIRKNRFNFFAAYSFSLQRTMAYVDIEREMDIQNSIFEFKSRAERKSGNDIQIFRMGMDYKLSPKTTVGVITSVYDSNWSQNTSLHADFRRSPGYDSLMNGYRNDKNLVNHALLNINLQHNLTETQQLNLDLDYFYYNGSQPQKYTFNYITNGSLSQQDKIRIDKNNPMDIWVGKLDYSMRPKDQITLESGAKITHSGFFNKVLLENETGGNWKKDPAFSEI